MDFSPGHRLGRFRIDEKVGSGGFGSVYRAFDTQLGRSVALKVLESVGAEHARIVAEARALASIAHPNVVQVFDVEDEGELTWLVMELVEGASLRTRMAEASQELRVSWLTQLADALAAAHAAGVVHRDVKPDNVLIADANQAVKLVDFGIARGVGQPLVGRDGDPASLEVPATQEGYVAGTMRYLSPEQLLGKPVTPAVDQWAWGVLAFETLAGKHPASEAGSATVAEWAVMGDVPRLPLELAPRHVAEVIARALRRAPEDRFPGMQAVATALRAGAPPSASPPSRRDVETVASPRVAPPARATPAAAQPVEPPTAVTETASPAPPVAGPPPSARGWKRLALLLAGVAAASCLCLSGVLGYGYHLRGRQHAVCADTTQPRPERLAACRANCRFYNDAAAASDCFAFAELAKHSEPPAAREARAKACELGVDEACVEP